MKTIKEISIPSIVNTVDDGVVLYCLSMGSTAILSIDIDSLAIITQFNIPHLNANIKPVCDDDFIYCADLIGNILKIDKFSGSIKSKIPVGQSIPISNIVKYDNNIYLLCKTPLSYGSRIDTNKMSFVVIDVTNSQRIFQSQLLPMDVYSQPVYLDDGVYFSTGKKLNIYQNQQLFEKNLTFVQTHPNIRIKDKLVCPSKAGTLEVLNEEYKLHARFLIAPNIVPPSLFNQLLVWPTNDGVYQIDPLTRKTSHLSKIQSIVCSQVVINNQLMITYTDKTIVISDKVETVSNEKSLNVPSSYVCSKNKLLYIYDHSIAQIGLLN